MVAMPAMPSHYLRQIPERSEAEQLCLFLPSPLHTAQWAAISFISHWRQRTAILIPHKIWGLCLKHLGLVCRAGAMVTQARCPGPALHSCHPASKDSLNSAPQLPLLSHISPGLAGVDICKMI